MSAQIDVLAVLDEFVVVVGDEFGNDPAVRLREARRAVAELVEADIMLDRTQEAYDRAAAGCIRNDLWDDVLAARKRRAAALARVGSAK